MTPRVTPRAPARSVPGPGAGGPQRFHQALAAPAASPLGAVGSVLALIGLLVVVPLALWLVAGPPPLPRSLPDRDTLTQTIGAAQVVAVLVAVVWLAWAQFAVCVVVEVVAAMRGGVLARPVPLSAPSQRLARALVAGVLVSAVLAVQPAAAATALQRPTVVAALSLPVTVDGAADAGRAAPSATQPAVPATAVVTTDEDAGGLAGKKVYVVQPAAGRHHESLWEIAERHLGDGRRYRDIFQLNHGRVQPDGRTLELARLIQPGWLLVMPEDAVGVERLPQSAPVVPPPPPPTPAPAPPSSAPTPAPTTAAPTTAAPTTAAPTHATAVAAPPITVAGTQAGVPVAPPSATQAPAAPSPATAASHSPASHSPASHSPAIAAPAGTTVTASAQTSQEGAPWLFVETGLFAAGLLGALFLARRRGRPVEPSAAAVEVEVRLRIGADTARARLLESALHGLRLSCETSRTPLPSAYGALVDDQAVTLMLWPAEPQAPAPWTSLDDGERWRLHRSEAPRPAPTVRGGPPSPMPGLVSVGRDAQGRDVLIDLRAAGGPVCVTGDAVVAAQVVRALALELGTNPWSYRVQVTGVGLPPELACVGARVDVPTDSDDPLAGLRERLGRRHVPDEDEQTLEHVVLGEPPSRDLADELRRLGEGHDLGILVAGDVPGARWRLVVDEAGTLTVSELDVSVRGNRVGDAGLAAMSELFGAAEGRPARPGRRSAAAPTISAAPRTSEPAAAPEPAAPESAGPESAAPESVGPESAAPTGARRRSEAGVPLPGVAVDDAAWSAADVRVAVLGHAVVETPGTIDPSRIDQATELVAYLALHPEGVHPNVLGAALWPFGVTPDVRDATVERVRDWLGRTASGGYRLFRDADDRLRLSPDVVVDWDVVCTLLTEAGQVSGEPAERELLTRALRLVRGPIAGGPGAGQYAWLARTDYERITPAVLTTAAHRLCGLLLPEDPARAADAAQRGLLVDPVAPLLWRDLIRARHKQWGPPGVRQVASEMSAVFIRLSCDVDPPTLALLDDLAPGASALVL